MRVLLLAGMALCFAGLASGQVLSVSCTPPSPPAAPPSGGPTTAGVAYSATCTASGGIAPYPANAWSISSGALPAGLTLTQDLDPNNDTATIAGTPTTSGSYSYTVQVTDSTPVIPQTATQNYSGTVAPSITGISPTSTTAGQPGLTLTVNGAGFGSDSVVYFNSTALTTTVTPGNTTQVTASIPASLLTLAVTATITLTSGGATSNGQPFAVFPTVTPPLSPSSATAGGPTFPLTVNGTGFQSGATVSFNGTTLSTSVANPTQLTASVPASLITSAGTLPVFVTSGGLPSNSVNFTVVPPPSISSISPTSTPAGSAAFTLTLNGSNFGAGSVVNFNSNALTPSSNTGSQLTANVPANLLTNAGPVSVTVTSGGVTSSAASFTIAAPVITSINPGTVTAGGSSFPLTVNGSGFGPSAAIQWTVSGTTTTLTTSDLSSAELTTTVPSNLIAAPGSAQITVTSGNSTSSPVTLTIVAGPALSGISPDTITAGYGSFSLTANGTDFGADAVVQWTPSGGSTTALSTTVNNPQQLTATVPGSLVASVGSASVNVLSGGVTSNSLTFTIVAAPTISSIMPNTITAGSADFTLTVNGSGFAAGAQVKWNGNALGVLSVSPGLITATVPASDVTSPGTAHITVTSGGVTSNSVNFTVVAGPAVTLLTPNTATAGGSAFTLTISGTGYASNATAYWNTTSLTTKFVSAEELTASVPANLIASPATVSITVRSNGVTSNALSFSVVAGPAITSISPTSITGGTGAGLGAVGSCPGRVYPAGTLTVNGSGFTVSSTVDWNGQSMLTNFVSSAQLTACVSSANIQGYGTAKITVVSGNTTSNAATITLVIPAMSITGLQSTSAPTQQLSLGIHLASATPTALQGTALVTFSSTAPGLPSGYADPGLQFSTGGTTASFTIGAGASSASIAALQQGTVEGTITVTLTSLTANGASVLPASTVIGTVAIPQLPPVITPSSVQITNVTSSGFDVLLTGYSVTRDVMTANFTFTAASGSAFSGTSTFSVPVGPVFASWFDSAAGQQNGSMFLLTVPFTISGPTSVLGSVSVTLTNSVGTSAPESAAAP